MVPSRSTSTRPHGDWRSPRAEAARRRDEAVVEAEAAKAVPPALSALRRGREAVTEIDGQLDEVMGWVKGGKRPARDLPERMAASSRRAGEALTGLGTLLYHDGPAGSELF